MDGVGCMCVVEEGCGCKRMWKRFYTRLMVDEWVVVVTVVWCGGGGGGGGGVVEAQAPIGFPDDKVSDSDSRIFFENRSEVIVPPPSPPRPVAPPAIERIRTTIKPPCAPGQGTTARDPCEEDTEYDGTIRDYIQRLIENDKTVAALVGDPTLSNLLLDVNNTIVRATTRFGTSESPVCDAQETLIYPQRAQSAMGDWVFVVNQDGAKQAIRVEKCINEGKSCRLGMTATRDIKTTCRQKYVYRRMLTLNTNKLLPEEVLMPSCCVCYSTNVGEFGIGVRVGNTTNRVPAPEGSADADPIPRTNTARPQSRPQTHPLIHSFHAATYRDNQPFRNTGHFNSPVYYSDRRAPFYTRIP
ncbi:hypothetical protein Pmani_028566 [Petrolisthes manimaculis]|uniref:Spaetzle domain-containing protein n=1 Tax=Petrolisthes manimaculis TaxID=1843537 RepID=A0AAE1P0G8_9EUCA|nr:hypothetical protein Pmani_028566 [Petrolisthes manimaculis]